MFSLVGFDCKGQVIPSACSRCLIDYHSVWKQPCTADLAASQLELRQLAPLSPAHYNQAFPPTQYKETVSQPRAQKGKVCWRNCLSHGVSLPWDHCCWAWPAQHT